MIFFYHLALFLYGLVFLPVWLCQKKHRSSWKQKLGFNLPKIERGEGPLIWIHAVSMGEMRMIAPIYHKLRDSLPYAKIIITSTTETGQNEAKRNFKDAEAIFFLPFDLVISRALRRYKPDLLLLCESDFWLQLLRGTKTLLINGKMSEKSLKNYLRFPSFSKELFSQIDHFALQSQEYADRFRKVGVPSEKIIVTGNLKLDAGLPLKPKQTSSRTITVGSTHEGEEELILNQLKIVWTRFPEIRVFFAPRHPERFEKVAKILAQEERAILIDQMGILPTLYPISELAIVGGSFLPGTGGHNIFEPIQAHIPPLFGPYMDTQQEMVNLVLKAEAGIQCPIENIAEKILSILENPATICERAKALSDQSRGALDRTWPLIQKCLSIKVENVKL